MILRESVKFLQQTTRQIYRRECVCLCQLTGCPKPIWINYRFTLVQYVKLEVLLVSIICWCRFIDELFGTFTTIEFFAINTCSIATPCFSRCCLLIEWNIYDNIDYKVFIMTLKWYLLPIIYQIVLAMNCY